MKLNKAIENLEQLDYLFTNYLHKDFENSWRLGIEALKRVREYRPDMGGNDAEPLPGETKE